MYSDSYHHSTIRQGVSDLDDDVDASFNLRGSPPSEKDNVN